MMSLILSVGFLALLCFLSMWWELMFFMIFIFMYLIYKLSFNNFYSFFSYGFCLDLLSLVLVLLSLWIVFLMLMASYKFKENFNSVLENMLVCLFLLLFLCLSFMTNNIFMFYVFFEASLIPTLFLIYGWGYQPERLSAGFYLLFYTLFASLPLLVCIFYLYSISMSMIFVFFCYLLMMHIY